MSPKWRPAEDRFWEKVEPTGFCWNWTGCVVVAGYGRFGVGNGVVANAHRWAYEYLVGPIPEGADLDHLCRNRACVNPDHLEPVTRGDNVLRGFSSPAANARKTHCKNGHEFTEENTIRRRGTRECRTCVRLADRRRRPPGSRRRRMESRDV